MITLCDIAPFKMECINEDYKEELMSCNICRLCWAFNEMWLQIPIIRNFVVPYKCPNFQTKVDNNKN